MCVYFKWRTVASSCHGDVHRSIGPHRRRAFKVNVRKGEWEAAGTPGGHWWTGSAWEGKLKQRRKTIYVVGGRGGDVAENAWCLLKLKYHSVFLSFFSSFELLSSDLINYFVWFFLPPTRLPPVFWFWFLFCLPDCTLCLQVKLHFSSGWSTFTPTSLGDYSHKKHPWNKQTMPESVIKPDCNVR